jgi:serine/threonine protein kinase
MATADRCPECGGTLKAGADQRLCARCLLAAALRSAATPPDDPAPAGETFGSFRLVRLLGEGGMGMVYLAEQDQPIARQVAIKIIKLGMDTRAVLSRFQLEQQALARMDHPNIARVYEAGSSEQGRPYFVMEYVPGVPITEYCDRHRLDTRQRLELFVQVANAVQHAHQKGVIHRDLKPSNVLVMERDGEAVPKIIDFGLAKATEQRLTEESLFTETGVLIGTPEYMSPEQASLGGTHVDTRTDIYSLGVLLYELLVGAVPFDSRALRAGGYDEIRRVIRETDPPRPASRLQLLGTRAAEIASRRATDVARLRKQVQGDLDWITLKTLEKDPARRYASASDLAADIRRHCDGEPVSAAPPSGAYRLRKFAARHVLELTAAAVVLLALLAGLVLSIAYYLRSEYQRERTERLSYRASLGAAVHLLGLKQPDPAREFLLACAPGMRSWEWRHLWHEANAVPAAGDSVFRRTGEPIAAMAIASRSGSVALGLESGAVEILAADGALAHRWTAGPSTIRSLALSPDGTRLVTADGARATLWDVASNRALADLPSDGPPSSVDFSPDRRTVAVGSSDGTVVLWRADTGTRAEAIRTGQSIDSVDFPSDAGLLTTAGGGSVRLWLLPGGNPWRTYKGAFGAFSGDGRLALTAALGKAEARAWNPRGGPLVCVLHTGSEVVSAAIRADRIVTAARRGAIQFWNAPNCEHLLSLPAAPGIRSIAFSPDGTRLLGLYQTEVRMWDTLSAQAPRSPSGGPYGEIAGTAGGNGRIAAIAGAVVLVVLVAAVLYTVLFRRRRWWAEIPAPPVSPEVATAVRWLARVLGTFWAMLFVVHVVREGLSWPSQAEVRGLLLVLTLWMIAGGLILAWIWEVPGGLCTLAGFAIHVALRPALAAQPTFVVVLPVCLAHILCRLRLRAPVRAPAIGHASPALVYANSGDNMEPSQDRNKATLGRLAFSFLLGVFFLFPFFAGAELFAGPHGEATARGIAIASAAIAVYLAVCQFLMARRCRGWRVGWPLVVAMSVPVLADFLLIAALENHEVLLSQGVPMVLAGLGGTLTGAHLAHRRPPAERSAAAAQQ